MFPHDFFSYLVEDHKDFGESKSVRVRGTFMCSFKKKTLNAPVYKIIHPKFSKKGLDVFKVDFVEALKKVKITPEEAEQFLMDNGSYITRTVKLSSKKRGFKYCKPSEILVSQDAKKSNVAVLGNGHVMIAASETS